MNGTLFSLDLLNTPLGLVAAGIIGFLFGFFLEQAGFGSSRRLTGIFYLRDMSVLKVMFTAIVVALMGSRILTSVGLMQPSQIYLLDTYWGAQIVGGALFGVGFVVGGWCPGTAFVGVASAKLDAVVFLAGAGLGSVLFNELYAWIEPLYNGMHAGPVTLADTLGLSMDTLTFLLCGIAVIAFALSSKAEQKFGGASPEDLASRLYRRGIAAGLLLVAALLFLMPEQSMPTQSEVPPDPVSQAALAPQTSVPPRSGASALPEVDAAADHVDAPVLAGWMMERRPGLTVIDIRDPEEYRKFHLRGAVNMPLAELSSRSQTLPKERRIVLYSNGTTHAAQAWLEMRSWGFSQVLVLTDGILGFWRECLTPPSLRVMPSDEREAAVIRQQWERCKAWFLDAAAE